MQDWLGTEKMKFKEARLFVRKLGLKSGDEWDRYCRGELTKLSPLPSNIPKTPSTSYKREGWVGINDWLGTKAGPSNVDEAIRKFSHIDGKVFEGTAYKFTTKYSLDRSSVTKLINGKNNSHKGWRFVE